jgi:hypothetical protein
MKINIKIDRQYEEKQTLGHYYMEKENGDTFQCKCLELPWKNNAQSVSCIPEGIYRVIIRHSQKYSRHLHITNVDGRSYILVHWGNYAGSKNPKTGSPDIRGCVLVGKAHLDIDGDGLRDITASKVTFNKMMSYVEDGDEVELEICGNGGPYAPLT